MDDTEDTRFRVAGAIVLTPDNMDAVVRQDTLDSILLAQLAAAPHQASSNPPDKSNRPFITSLGKMHWTLISSKSTETRLIIPFSAVSVMNAALQPQESDFAKALADLPSDTRLNLKHYCSTNLDGITHINLLIIKTHESAQIQVKQLMFASTSPLEDDWLIQQHNACVEAPVQVRLADFSLTLTPDYKEIRNKVIASLGQKRIKEIQVVN